MQKECKCPPPGLPGWMATFSDLMSLLMCFFVLLLSYSEMDVLKFKQIAGSMKYAFGVQNKLEVKDIPKGTSVIAQEFRPGRPEPTPIDTIEQQTLDMSMDTLNFQAGDMDTVGGQENLEGEIRGGKANAFASDDQRNQKRQQDQAADSAKESAKEIEQQLSQQVMQGMLEVEALGQQIVIRIRENGSFPSGSAFLQPRFKPVIQQIGEVIKDMPGEITVTGHTDNGRIRDELYRSNWELSSQRAVAVAHELLKVENFGEHRMTVTGLAGTRPLEANIDASGRQRNRRVEIAIMQGKPKESEPLQALVDDAVGNDSQRSQ